MTQNEQFEKWYCETYWNFKVIDKPVVFFENGKYSHFDVDLAYNAYLAGQSIAANDCKEIALNVSPPLNNGGAIAILISEKYRL